MKILLIDPPFKSFAGIFSLYFPLGLTYVAGAAKKAGHQCRILDMDAAEPKEGSLNFTREYESYNSYVSALNDPDHPTWKLLRQLVLQQKPDLIGITALTTKFGSVIQTARFCKQVLPNVPIVVGGAHASTMPDLCMQIPEVDFVLRGESDESFAQLLEAVEKRRNLNQVGSLSWRDSEKIVHNPDLAFAGNLDELPLPDRSALLNPENYSSEDMGVILTSRGCPFRCSYCFHMWDQKVRYRSPASVIEEILQVHRTYGTTQFSIKDDSFTVKKKHVLELCEAFKRLPFKITFNCTTRVDLLDEELLLAMRNAGCAQISLGIESGSPSVLKDTDKDITLEQVMKAAEMLNRHRLFWTGYFMIGLPRETEEDIRKTLQFLKKVKPFYAGLGVYNPFPRTKLFRQGVELGLLDPNPPIDHFLKTNPKDLFFKDPQKRLLNIDHERFSQIAQ
ncbi:MAG: radical SAM protein, partial [Candidatus Riflebacteria bacterium]